MFFLLLNVGQSLSAKCNMAVFGDCIEDARLMLVSAAAQTDLAEAQYYAKKAARELNLSHDGAMECRVGSATLYFTHAADAAGKAEDAGDPSGFVRYLDEAIDYFNKALMELDVFATYAIQREENQPGTETEAPRGATDQEPVSSTLSQATEQ
jgi:hypothetical protein